MKTRSFLLLSFLCCIVTLSSQANAKAEYIEFDRKPRSDDLPKYRIAKGSYRKNSGKNLSTPREGLERLHASASGQPNAGDLEWLAKAVPADMSLIIVDLRLEKHGFLNGEPINWHNGEIEQFSGQATLNVREREGAWYCVDNKLLSTEPEETAKLGIRSETFSTKDHQIPTDEVIQKFVDFVDSLEEDIWVHFHCKEGAGRATTYMIMYDMLHNADHISKEDIVHRQFLIGGARIEKHLRYAELKDFLDKFYLFSQMKIKGAAKSWLKFTNGF